MDVQKLRKIHVKFEQCKNLTDSELTALITYYDNLVKALDAAYLPMFSLMQREAWANQRRLHYFRDSRANK